MMSTKQWKPILLFLFVCQHVFAQDRTERPLCSSHHKMDALNLYPSYLQARENLINTSSTSSSRGTVYTIPVVFHVLHVGGVENISDEQIFNAMEIINRDFRLLNADANNVNLDFRASNPNAFVTPADIEVEFQLATKAPDGTCFNGITRTFSPVSYQGEEGFNQVQTIIENNNVYQGHWPSRSYLNIFVCGDIGGAAGYTFLPGGWFDEMETYFGIWMLSDYVGAIGTGSVSTSRALTHEIGHWLGLPHTWGGTNEPGVPDNCFDDDGVDDTPNCQGVTSCNQNANTCNDPGIWAVDVRDNVENYMDYSYCSKMFTPGQAALMRAVLESSLDGRNNLWSQSNLAETGVGEELVLCRADFSVINPVVCSGTSVQFTDQSFNNVQSWNWSFPGGIPATSTEENPVVVYATPGNHTVTLTVSDGTNSLTKEKIDFIQVLNTPTNLPIYEGFEPYVTVSQIPFKVQFNTSGPTWSLYNNGQFSAKSMCLFNFLQSPGDVDELISEPIDLSGITSQTDVTLSFRFAHRKTPTTGTEFLKVFISNDCGQTWVQRRTISGTALSTESEQQYWTPTNDDWKTVHVTNITSSYWVENFMYKFVFEANGGNNLYVDNINIYAGGPSELNVDELNSFSHFSIFPNPAEDQLTVSFPAAQPQEMTLELIDLTGKVLMKKSIQAQTGENQMQLSTQQFEAGMYHVRIGNENNVEVKTVILR